MRIPYQAILILFLGTSRVTAFLWPYFTQESGQMNSDISSSSDNDYDEYANYDDYDDSDDNDSDYDNLDDGGHPTYTIIPNMLEYAWNGATKLVGDLFSSKSEDEKLPIAKEVKENIVITEDNVKPVENIIEIDGDDMIPDEKESDDSIVPTMPSFKTKQIERVTPDQNADKVKKEKALSRAIVNDFLTKVSVDYEAERKKLRPIPVATSPNYQNILKLLHESYMGEFDFSKVVSDKQFRYTTKNHENNLIPDYLGQLWLKKKWTDLSNETSVTALHEIKSILDKEAKETMSKLPSLAPKKTYEKEVLEGWLVHGLLAAYPTLTAGVSKNDAIALILLAVLSKSFTDPENREAINNLMQELHKYNGNIPGKFPLDEFDLDAAQSELIEKLFRIIGDKGLPYAAEVVSEILEPSEKIKGEARFD